MFPPRSFRSSSGVNARLLLVPHVFDTPDDPVGLQLGTSGPVTERGRALWSIEEEEIREAGGCHTQVGPGAESPFGFEGLAVDAFDVDLGETAGDGIEAGGEDEDVEFVEARGRLHACRFDFDDGVVFEGDEVDVGLVVYFVVALFETWSFGAECVWCNGWCFYDQKTSASLPNFEHGEVCKRLVPSFSCISGLSSLARTLRFQKS